MSERKSSYIDVQSLMPQVSLEQATTYYGVTLPEVKRIGHEIRTRCFLNCGKSEETGDRALAIQADSATKIWKCFNYGCAKGGNLVGICDLLKPGENGSGRPRGDRFKEIARDLQRMVQGKAPDAPTKADPLPATKAPAKIEKNIPLAESDNERVQTLIHLPQEFVVDPAEMPPGAAAYFRRREFLTPGVCREFGVGYLPRSSKSLLRGKIVYPFLSAAGQVLCFFGRDVLYEEKFRRWVAGGREGTEPAKYTMPKTFKRGLECWGENIVREKILGAKLLPSGLVVVEGANDAIRLLLLGAPAVALCSNTITPRQVERIVQLAADCGQSYVSLMLDTDAAGEQGLAQILPLLSERIPVQRLWSRTSHDAKFADRQPESLSPEEWTSILESLRRPANADELDPSSRLT